MTDEVVPAPLLRLFFWSFFGRISLQPAFWNYGQKPLKEPLVYHSTPVKLSVLSSSSGGKAPHDVEGGFPRTEGLPSNV